MKAILLETFLIWPMALVWLFVMAGVVRFFGGRRWGKRLVVAAGLGLIVSSLPVTGAVLRLPLTAETGFELDMDADAIVVLTGGIYQDMAGDWWGEDVTIRRVARGRQLQAQTGLPLFIAGGVVEPGQPSEARVAVTTMAIPFAEIGLEEGSSNTIEMGPAIAALLADRTNKRVVLVTSPVHVLRASAVLRRNGMSVLSAPILGDARANKSGVRLFVPNVYGLDATEEALREYLGIAWYLLRGHISPRDLLS